jgi:hypothetical protein
MISFFLKDCVEYRFLLSTGILIPHKLTDENFVMPDVGTNFHAMFCGAQFPVPGI